MNFKLTTRFSSVSRRVRKDWLSECKKYRIVWRKEYEGIELPPRYFALRQNYRACDGRPFWDFALDSERRPYKTFRKAYVACCNAAGVIVKAEDLPKRARSKIIVKKEPVQDTTPLVKRGRGRPKGSKNKPKESAPNLQVKRGRGRPKKCSDS
jgi:hypothetical protein